MKGNNELRLNEATMIEAVQEYLDKRAIVPKDRVTSVKANNSYGFEVKIAEAEAPAVPE
jgi:hypothetical protein